MTSRKFQISCLLVFLLSLCLRGAFTRYNRSANDDHIQVVRLILANNTLPTKSDCGECFQPKLFHYTVAKVIQMIGMTSAIEYRQVLIGQILNFFAGILTIAIVWIFISNYPGENRKLKLFSFSLVALNPVLIGINSQATNDSFVILFSTLALYFAYIYLAQQKKYALPLSLLFILLGIASKLNAWVTAIAIFISILVYAFVLKGHSIKLIMVAFSYILIVAVLSIFNPLTQYLVNAHEYGSPILSNMDPAPLPVLFAPPVVGQPSVFSIQDNLLSYKFIELLKKPRIEYKPLECPPFCSSLWTVLYGRANSLHFDNWPPSWSTSGEDGFTLTRAIFVLALLPTLLFLAGGVIEIWSIVQGILRRDMSSLKAACFGLFGITGVGFGFFITLYALFYENNTVMKAIFVFPGLLIFLVFFLKAGEKLYHFICDKSHWLLRILDAWIILLLTLYVWDVATMILNIYMKLNHI